MGAANKPFFRRACIPYPYKIHSVVEVRGVEKLLRSSEVADALSVSVWHIGSLVRQGKLRCVRVGGRSRRFLQTDVDAFVKASRS